MTNVASKTLIVKPRNFTIYLEHALSCWRTDFNGPISVSCDSQHTRRYFHFSLLIKKLSPRQYWSIFYYNSINPSVQMQRVLTFSVSVIICIALGITLTTFSFVMAVISAHLIVSYKKWKGKVTSKSDQTLSEAAVRRCFSK